ncbi:hypothetical protein ACQPW3_26000 [Actinosynnema sp. CA-248983]
MDPEHPGKDHRKHFGGEGEQRGGAILLGPDPDLVEAPADLVFAEGGALLTTGEEPGASSEMSILACRLRREEFLATEEIVAGSPAPTS